MSGAIPPLPKTSWRGAKLKHRDNFTCLPFIEGEMCMKMRRSPAEFNESRRLVSIASLWNVEA
jgi:hypothetical protein